MPPARPGELARSSARTAWRPQIRDLAGLPNVWCKVSGVITEAERASWTRALPAPWPHIDHVIDCFGFGRVMCASDWRVSEQTHRYAEWVGMVGGRAEKAVRHNAIAFYRLDGFGA